MLLKPAYINQNLLNMRKTMKMKKIVATFLMMVCFGHCYAQDAANLVEKVDSLEQEVRCLNANITFIRCHYRLEIFRLKSEIFRLDLDDELDELGDVLAGRNTAITYESLKESIEHYKKNYSWDKEDYDFLKKEVSSWFSSPLFNEEDKQTCISIEKQIEINLQSIKNGLDLLEKWTEELKGS